MRLSLILAVLMLCMSVPGWTTGAGPSLQQIEELNSLETDIPTAHTKWAKPWAGGRIRVLFLVNLNANINGLPLRPAVELLQRFDMDADAVLVMPAKGNTYTIAFPGESGVYGGEAGEQRLARLLEKPYDCYVVTGPIMGHVPDVSRKLVMKRVRDGAGLVLLYKPGEQDAPLLSGSVQVDKQPQMLRGLNADVRQLGRGRVVTHVPQNWSIYNRTPAEVFGLAHIFGTDLPRDLRFEKQGRAILWAAGREPEMQLSVELPSQSLKRRACTLFKSGSRLPPAVGLSGFRRLSLSNTKQPESHCRSRITNRPVNGRSPRPTCIVESPLKLRSL